MALLNKIIMDKKVISKAVESNDINRESIQNNLYII